jgi:hypothetical protein
MSEHEVDRIFADWSSYREPQARRTTYRGQPLVEPSTFAKLYKHKANSEEYDYFVEVYFDKAGRVVGKDYGDYSR